MGLTLALMTDLHFGPKALFDGKLRKMSHLAPALTAGVVEELRERVRPDLLVNLGDDIEDESPELDRERYSACQGLLRGAGCPLINVAGNHDTIHLTHDELAGAWGRRGHLHYTYDFGGYRFVVLHTVERKDIDVSIDGDQLAWLRGELARAALPVVVLMHHSASEQDLADSYWFSAAPHLALLKNRAELRRVVRESGKVVAVFNGHVHRNHVDVIGGVPYITIQSLIENVDDDAPGRAAGAYALATFDERRLVVRVRGLDPARYQFERELSGRPPAVGPPTGAAVARPSIAAFVAGLRPFRRPRPSPPRPSRGAPFAGRSDRLAMPARARREGAMGGRQSGGQAARALHPRSRGGGARAARFYHC